MEVTISIVRSLKRVRSTSMRILNKGVVELRAPYHAHVQTLINFVASNRRFLAKSLTVPTQTILPGTLTTGDDIYLFGKHYLIELLPAQQKSITINNEDKVIVIHKRGRTISRKQLFELLAPTLLAYVRARATELAPIMSNIPFKSIRTKLVRSLWGSCTHTGALTFNQRLIHYPYDIIDYVIVHELAHLQQHNHSKNFWDIVEKHYPDVKNARLTLKKRVYG